MVKYIFSQIKYKFSQLRSNRKREIKNRLKESFGKIKTDNAFDSHLIENYFNNKDNSKAHQVLSDKTCSNLDFDDLFQLIANY